jgi:photosystem II protein PsbQ
MNHSKNNIDTMIRLFRPVLSIMLVLVTTLLVSCSSPNKAKIPTVYTPEKIEQLQPFRAPIAKAREEMDTLKDLIQTENWVDTRTFIHGPLGELRQSMAIVSKKLLQKDQKIARNLARELFSDFDRIDEAAKERNQIAAASAYSRAIQDFDAYLDLVPSNS